MKVVVNSPCCICSSTISEIIFEKEYPSLGYPEKFTMRLCKDCGLLFNSPRLKDNELYNLYTADYYFFHRRDSDEINRVTSLFLRTAALIENDSIEKCMAEIGSAKGYFLALMKHLGWNVFGIEISTAASQYAISQFGIPTYNGTIEDYSNSIERKTFPVVMAIDVIEHVPDPISFLNSIDKILSSNGILIIDTPNGNSFNIDHLGSKWPAFNPFHIFVFSEKNLRILLSKMGYSIEKCFSYNNCAKYFNIRYRINELLIELKIQKFVKYIYQKITDLMKGTEKNIESSIDIAIEKIHNKRTYFNSADSIKVLSKENRGDNIVLIARKN